MADVKTRDEGPVRVVEFDRPERANSIAGTLMRDYLEAMEEAERDDSVRVVVTTGSGRTFCVGADLEELERNLGGPVRNLLNDNTIGGDKGLPPMSPKQFLLESLGVGRWAQRLYALTKPSIAALNGAAAGGGLAIAVAHDYRIASRAASLVCGFLSVGAAPELGISHRLPRLIGWRAARDLMLENRRLSADEACAVGLVDAVVEPDALIDAAMARAQRLAAQPDIALRLTKSLLWASTENRFDDQLRAEYAAQVLLFELPETQKIVGDFAARLANRPPRS